VETHEFIIEKIANLKLNETEYVFEETNLIWHPIFDIKQTKTRQLIDLLKNHYFNKRVLEIGYPWAGRQIPNSKVLDLYDPRPDIDYRIDVCDMSSIPNNSFDLLLSDSVLEHIPRFWLAAEEMQRVLDINGLIFIGVPAVWAYHPGDVVNFGGDYWRMTHQGLEFLFSKSCKKIASWYASPVDDSHAGWGVGYLGRKI
jgi:SAM-dependent methyltransferase